MPHEITWTDAKKGDAILALCLHTRNQAPTTIDFLQIWHVLDVEDDTLRVEVNCLVGAGADGEYIYDRFAGLLGLPPGVHGERL